MAKRLLSKSKTPSEMIGSVLLKIGQEVTAVLGKKKIAPSFSFDQMTLNLPRTRCKF
jgi:hypothetical protein